jgi:predicted ATPase
VSGEPRQQLLDYLRGKEVLLLLDNFEHLLEGAGLATEVLQAAPGVVVLVTSRARLNLQGEHLVHVAGMDCPPLTPPRDAEKTPKQPVAQPVQDVAQYAAIQLVLQGARRIRPGLQVPAEELAHVTHICHLVQGMPLAILLAAAWVEMLAPAEIVAQLSAQGIDFLESGWRDVPRRQRSMRAVLDHSWTLLAERERQVLAGLSVFRGGFTQEAAQEITDASLRNLMTLTNRSLLHRMPGGRYEAHELLRQYAEEQLDRTPEERERIHDRHCEYYAEFLHRREARSGEGDRRRPCPRWTTSVQLGSGRYTVEKPGRLSALTIQCSGYTSFRAGSGRAKPPLARQWTPFVQKNRWGKRALPLA